jgi:hypothetical protein
MLDPVDEPHPIVALLRHFGNGMHVSISVPASGVKDARPLQNYVLVADAGCVGERREGHTDLFPIVVIGAPLAWWIVAFAVMHGEGSALVYALLFLVAPFVICVAVLSFAGARTAAVPAGILSSALGGLSWLAVVVLFAAKFAN